MDTLSSYAAGAMAKRARNLLRRGDLTHRDLVLLDCLLWSCRQPGRAVARVSYTRLQKLARLARATIGNGLRRLERVGLIKRQKTRIRVTWGLGTASRQGVTIYHLLAPPVTEFTHTTVTKKKDFKIQNTPLGEGVTAALGRLKKAMEKSRGGDMGVDSVRTFV
jgi:hypothetical protein